MTNPFFFPFETFCFGSLSHKPRGEPNAGCQKPLLGSAFDPHEKAMGGRGPGSSAVSRLDIMPRVSLRDIAPNEWTRPVSHIIVTAITFDFSYSFDDEAHLAEDVADLQAHVAELTLVMPSFGRVRSD